MALVNPSLPHFANSFSITGSIYSRPVPSTFFPNPLEIYSLVIPSAIVEYTDMNRAKIQARYLLTSGRSFFYSR